MSATWQELASLKRAGESQLVERYRIEFFKGEAPSEGRGYPVTHTPWGVAREFFPAMYLAGISQRSAWPETQLVLNMHLEFLPERRVTGMLGIWPPDRWDELEPPYNEMFAVNLAEAIHKYPSKWLAPQRGPVVYFIWSSPVDFEKPPAPGAPPPELLSARAEVESIKRGWLDDTSG
jgi:hypothetical protein